MTTFLKQVAEHYYNDDTPLGRLCFIFPNRRSMVFFNKWLSDIVKDDEQAKPVVAPQCLTMNDFFLKVGRCAAADRISLLLELYECYRKLNPKAETLDDFIFWGDMLLSDFDDVDKYLADPKQLYTNIADLKEIQDTYQYLTDAQRAAIEKFVSHFCKGGKLLVNLDADKPDVKERFLQIWNLLYPLYVDFNKSLSEKGLSYEGMAYRKFAEKLGAESAADILSDVFLHTDKFVFVGLNALNECEKTVMRKMRDAHLAEFCWDYSSKMVRDENNKASMFMSQNVAAFPQAFDFDGTTPSSPLISEPKIHVISVPSSVGQVKYVPQMLKDIAEMKTGGDLSKVGNMDEAGADTAIVLPDEGLLVPLLNSVPPEIESVNVTMGYPMTGSEIYSLMESIASLQLHLRQKKDGWAFYHKQVWSIFSSGIISALLDKRGREVMRKIKADVKYYVPQSDFEDVWPFSLIFRPVVTDQKKASSDQVRAIADYQLEILNELGARLAEKGNMVLETNFAKQYYLMVNNLKSKNLEIQPVTYVRLLQKIAAGLSVPFRGEPLKGLQIMGPLEMRSLDFTNLIIPSCNEGMFPRRSVSSSFIPPELRKCFGLPTYENQDAVWSYYFFRMIQRAENVWLLYDSRTEGIKSGEESRYIKQLDFQYKYKGLDRMALKYRILSPKEDGEVKKSDKDMEVIRNMTFSASSLQCYLKCPMKFYYSSVCKLKDDSQVEESLDEAMVGNVFHSTMYALYTGGDALKPDFDMDRANVTEKIKSPLTEVTKDYLEYLIKNRKEIVEPKVKAQICMQLKSDEVLGRNLVLERIIYEYVMRTLQVDLDLLEENGASSFQILGLEKEYFWDFEGYRLHGFLDRMDSFRPGVVRIIDYKTGKVDKEHGYVEVEPGKEDDVVNKLFGVDVSDRPEKLLQIFLYDMYVREEVGDKKVENVFYSIPGLFKKQIVSSEESETFNELALPRLKDLLDEISNPEIPFRRTADDWNNCKWCDFGKLCGRFSKDN